MSLEVCSLAEGSSIFIALIGLLSSVKSLMLSMGRVFIKSFPQNDNLIFFFFYKCEFAHVFKG